MIVIVAMATNNAAFCAAYAFVKLQPKLQEIDYKIKINDNKS
jgi:hypothetical protein